MRYLVLASIGVLLIAHAWITSSPRHEAPAEVGNIPFVENEADLRLITELSQYMRSER